MNEKQLVEQQRKHLSKYRNDPKMRLVDVGEDLRAGDVVVTCVGPFNLGHEFDGAKVTKNGPDYPYGSYFRRMKEDSDA